MAVTVQDRRGRIRSALAALLTVAMLVPVGFLFARAWRATSDEIALTRDERRGVEYLGRLGPLLTAATEAQAEAVLGRGGELSGLDAPTAGVAEVDQRLGAELGTRERWSTLRRKIAELPDAAGSPLVVFQAHVEASDLLVALFDAVRDNSALVRDPDSDISHLQQAFATDLPQAVVSAARLADVTVLMSKASAAEKRQLGPAVGAAAAAAEAAVNQLTDNLQQAVDDTDSRTLSSSMLGALDRFRLGMEGVVQAATGQGGPSPGRIAPARTDLLQSVQGLNVAIMTETDRLLKTRLDHLRAQERGEWIIAGAAALLALFAVVLALTRRRRPHSGQAGRGSTDRRPGAPAASDPRYSGLRPGFPPPAGADLAPARRERSGALR